MDHVTIDFNKYYAIHIWDSGTCGIKTAIMNRETGKFLPHDKGNFIWWISPSKAKEAGLVILRGAKRKEFLEKFGWKLTTDKQIVKIGERRKSGSSGNVEKLLKESLMEGVIHCPKCHESLEPDAPSCSCGWENKLRKEGYI